MSTGTSTPRTRVIAGRVPKIRAARFEDYAGIASLVATYDLEVKREEDWRNLWLGNPAYTEFAFDWPIGWVLEGDRGEINGYLGNIPLVYEFQGRRVTTVNSYCWVVDEKHRTLALPLLDCFFRQKAPDLFVGTSVSRTALPAFRAFVTSPVPAGKWDESIFWITNYCGFAKSALVMKRVPGAELFSYGLSAALAFRDLPRRLALERHHGQAVFSVDDFGEQFDEFWRELARRNPHRLLAVRTREVLQWHFKHALPDGRAWIQTAQRDGRLVAYAIFLRQDSPKFGLKRVRMVDFQSLDGDAFLTSMLANALRRCRDEGVHMMECVGVHLDDEAVQRLAPRRRKLPSWMFYYRANRADLAAALADPSAWAPSSFDGDSSL